MRLTKAHSQTTVERGGPQLRRVSAAQPSRRDAGEALEQARDADRVWREDRSAAIQARIDTNVEAEDLGHRMRAWSFRLMQGGLCLMAAMGALYALLPRWSFAPWLVGIGACIFLVAACVGLVLLPISKILWVGSPIRRKWLRRQAARDHLVVRKPDRKPGAER